MKKHLFAIIATLLVGAGYYYVVLPALNIHDGGLLFFVALLCVVYGVCWLLADVKNRVTMVNLKEGHAQLGLFKYGTIKVLGIIVVLCLLVAVIGGLVGAKIFNAARYRELLTVKDGDFTKDVASISYDSIPRLDRDSASKLGDRKMGELSDMVSQFSVMDNYTQINYRGKPVRVTPLAYADLFKWMSNVKEGIPGYLMIDMVSQEVELVRLPEGMKYSTAEHFGRNLLRHLRFQYPTKIFADQTFEVNEEGTPYWICPTYEFRIGLYSGRDIQGAVLVNAITGESTYYDVADIPSWVDRVYNAELIIEQYDYYGTLVNGFWNSILAQKDCRVTTDGYNYMALGDDVYMYTGITSVAADESNVGFILCNQRTKETTFYPVPGAEEYSAMRSAEGQVQEMRYNATFPLLLNVAGEPTYFISLKDASELVKMYAMVNVKQYQVVVAATTVEECEKNYLQRLNTVGIKEEDPSANVLTDLEGVIATVRSAVVNGNSCYYYTLEGNPQVYSLSVATDERAAILNVGDAVIFQVKAEATGEIIPVQKLDRK